MQKEQEIVIHLGLHKTGSTYLQKCVFSRLKGVEVQHLMEICQVKFKSDKRVLLISSEGLLSSMPQYPDNGTVEDSIEALHRIYPDAKIILGVREATSWVKSCWNQYIRGGGTASFFEYCKKYGNNCMIPSEYIKPIKSRWKNVFVYDQYELKRCPYRIIEDMCDFIGVPMPRLEVKTTNRSFTNRKIRLLRIVNHCTFGLYNMVYAKVVSW